ncbi:MAG: pilus assembly protein [Streptosporangiaceae bacterium]|nr:pilus assembly protein [Streptosporangiaceae bacterium]MBV9855990.1 pilus assembly protein [Streptosporangiaceae bacterium]
MRTWRAMAGRGPGHDTERGSVTLFVLLFTIAALALASLIVDGGTVLNTEERAADIAQQAARAAADQISTQALRTTGQVVIDPQTACPAAYAIIQRYSVADNVQVTGRACAAAGQNATVTLTVTATPVIEIGFGSFTKTVHETATTTCGNAQMQQRGNC